MRMTMKRLSYLFALSAVMFVFTAYAEQQTRGAGVRKGKAEVRLPGHLCTKIAKSGKARMTELSRGKNAFIARLEMDPFAKVPEHQDPTEEYIHILQGSGTIYINGKPHPIGPGATVYMPANAKVKFENGPESLIAIQVFSGPQPADKYDAWKGCER